jgi:hypothetical protein
VRKRKYKKKLKKIKKNISVEKTCRTPRKLSKIGWGGLKYLA